MRTGRLEQQIALITGAASGIGAATARRFVEEGAIVIISDVSDGAGQVLAKELSPDGQLATYTRLDVSSEDDWNAALSLIRDRYGRLDILVNNAFHGIGLRISTAGLEAFRDQFRVTTDGVFLGLKLAPTLMSAGSAIVNMSSIAALLAAPLNSAYGAAKAAVSSLTRTAAIDFARSGRGIRVNSISPGLTRTPGLEGVVRVFYTAETSTEVEKGFRSMSRQVPIGRLGDPIEIANAILFLASDEASFVTGAELVVDGGQTME